MIQKQLTTEEKIKEYRKAYNKEKWQKKKDLYSQKNKAQYQKHKGKFKLRSKIYNQINKQALNEFTKNYRRDRYHTDEIFKLKACLRTRLYQTLKNNKKISSLKLLGCTLEEFKQYIDNKFQPNMSWDNYGEWHIDHIIPCSQFNLALEEEQKKCFHYTNLRPLWKLQNLTKSNKLPTLAIINCASTKKDFPCAASVMYDDSPIFRKLRDHVSQKYDRYYILSAYYGILDPDTIIDPYPHTVMFSTIENRKQQAKCLTTAEKEIWAKQVYTTIDWHKYSSITFHTGVYYWQPLKSLFSTFKNVYYKKMIKGHGHTLQKRLSI